MSFGQRNFDRERPEIEFPGETPPEELVIEDVIEALVAKSRQGTPSPATMWASPGPPARNSMLPGIAANH